MPENAKNIAVIICAAGAGSRFGGKRKKPFVDVAGRAAFLRSVELFTDHKDVKQVLLAISKDDQELVEVKWGANLKFFGIKTYLGGDERFDTVAKGLELIKDDIDLVAIHDAVRCCVTQGWIDACFKAAAQTGAAMLASRVVATIKKVQDSNIVETIDRTALYEAQTPQVFETELLRRAYANLKNLDADNISDDSQLVEILGEKVAIVETDSSNIKITRPGDVAIAEAIIKLRSRSAAKKAPAGPYSEAQW